MSTPKSEAMATKPPAIGSAHNDGVVVVEIGSERRKYYLHKLLLTFHSEYFRKALQGPWKEAQEGVVQIDDVEPGEFNVFVHWLYTQQLPESHAFYEWDHIMETTEQPLLENVLILLKAYALGDRLLATIFRCSVNKIITRYGFMCGKKVDDLLSVYQWAFANIPADRTVLQFLVDDFCIDWCEKLEEDSIALKDLPPAFFSRVLRYCPWKKSSTAKVYWHKRCYDEHPSEPELKECSRVHMKYDEKREFGYFEKED